MSILSAKIADEITHGGPSSFARFMELALYCPEFGYYEKEEDRVGRGGDFVTSVSIGPLFGELLGLWLADRIAAQGRCGLPAQVLEIGAHNGVLAVDALRCWRTFLPAFYEQVEYWIMEPSSTRQAWQRQRLGKFSNKVHWARSFEDLTTIHPTGIEGAIFSNELLDALPTHRVFWDKSARAWAEWKVACDGKTFKWHPSTGTTVDPKVADYLNAAVPPRLSEVLPDGFTTEFCPAAGQLWTQAARILKSGILMTIDYALETEEFFRPERTQGTLRADYRHHSTHDLLSRPGEQDITAHVNFTKLKQAGEAEGLKTDPIQNQESFLTTIAVRLFNEHAFRPWTGSDTLRFRALTAPDGLGRAFRVLVQAR